MEIRIQIASRLDDVALLCFGLTSKLNCEVAEAVWKGIMRPMHKLARRDHYGYCRFCKHCSVDERNRLAEFLWEWAGHQCIWCGRGKDDSSYYSPRCYGLCIVCGYDCDLGFTKTFGRHPTRRELLRQRKLTDQRAEHSADTSERMVGDTSGSMEPQEDEAAQKTKKRSSPKSKLLKWLLCSTYSQKAEEER